MIIELKCLPVQITVDCAVTWKCSGNIRCAEDQVIPEIPLNGLHMGHSFFLVVALNTAQERQRGID